MARRLEDLSINDLSCRLRKKPQLAAIKICEQIDCQLGRIENVLVAMLLDTPHVIIEHQQTTIFQKTVRKNRIFHDIRGLMRPVDIDEIRFDTFGNQIR